jgi:hypothetical protein
MEVAAIRMISSSFLFSSETNATSTQKGNSQFPVNQLVQRHLKTDRLT